MRFFIAALFLASCLHAVSAGSPARPGADAVPPEERPLKVDPAWVRAQINLGARLYEEGKFKSAIGVFLSVLEKDPLNEDALLYQRKAVNSALDTRAFVLRLEALRIWDDSVRWRRNRKRARRLAASAYSLIREGKLVEANEFMQKALDLAPTLSIVKRGIEELQGLLVAEISRLSRKEFHPQEKLFLKGFLAYNAGNFKGAVDAWERGLSYDVYTDLLKMKINPVRKDSEIVRLRLARARDLSRSKDSMIQAVLSEALVDFRLKRYSKALNLFRKVLKEKPDHSTIAQYVRFCENEVRPKKAMKAGRKVRRAGAEAPVKAVSRPRVSGGVKRWEAMYLEGIAAYMLGQLEEARDHLGAALRLNPKSPRVRKALRRVGEELRGR